MTVMMANFGSKTGGIIPAGKSAIWDHEGTLLARADETGEALVVARSERHHWTGRCI
jgi:predicted amidohydrolase